MNRFFHFVIAAMLVGFAAVSSFAQEERHKVEGFAGYSFLHSDTGLNEATGIPEGTSDLDFGSHGFNASVTGNIHRYVGLKFDFSIHSSERTVEDGFGDVGKLGLRTTQFLGGVQIKDNRTEGSRFRPFAHLLAGVAHQKLSPTGPVFIPAESGSINDPSMAMGGGIDINVSDRIGIRLIQIDYNPIFRKDHHFEIGTLPGRTQNNIRLGFGIVFH